MVKYKTIKDDGKLTVINVNGKYGEYDLYVQLGRVVVIPVGKKTTTYANSHDVNIKGVVIGEH